MGIPSRFPKIVCPNYMGATLKFHEKTKKTALFFQTLNRPARLSTKRAFRPYTG
jgi:hypothetical protein